MRRFFAFILTIVFVFSAFSFNVGCDDGDIPTNPTHIVWFDTGFDDVFVEPIENHAEVEVTLPTPTKEGYRFEGWVYNETWLDQTLIMPDFDLTLLAVWSRLCTITLETGLGTSLSIQAYCGDEIVAPADPQREGYIFTGWLLNEQLYTFSTMPNEDITLQASWERGIAVHFETDDDTIKVNTMVGKQGDKLTAPQPIQRDGYTFLGWFLGNNLYNFTTFPAEDIVLQAKWAKNHNLPVININLYDQNGNRLSIGSVTRELYVSSRISVSNSIESHVFNDESAQFKGRGHGSWQASKKGYRIKFDRKISMFGEQKSKHWVLNAGTTNQNDVSMARNYTAFGMTKNSLTNIEYVTSAHYIDLYFNGIYHGVYLVFEHVRVDEGRVEIESEYGVEDTGYLIEYDAYAVEDGGVEGVDYFRVAGLKYYFVVNTPDPEDYEEEGISLQTYKAQVNFIKNYTTSVINSALTHDFATFTRLADLDSFVDMYLLHEIFKNTDTGWSSFYMYKKKGGKMFAGPPWDFDLSAGGNRGDSSPQGLYVGVHKSLSPDTNSELFINLMKTSGFVDAVKARFKKIHPSLVNFVNTTLNESFIETNLYVMGKNYTRWLDLTQAQAESNWSTATRKLRTWLQDRLTWLNSYWNTI